MKRIPRYLAIFLTLLLAGALSAACGGAIETTPAEITSETATTRTVTHAFGTSDIPLNPQRVLALGEERLLADLLDLGIAPVASSVNVPDALPLIAADELAGTELFSSTADISIETLLAYNPDLIIGASFFIEEIGYDRLSEIAPTVALSAADPLEAYIETASVVGSHEQHAAAEADVAAFNQAVSAAAAEINATEKSVSVAAIYPGPNVALFVDGPQSAPQLLARMGVTLLPTGEERESLGASNGRAFISNERLGLLSGETLILLQAPAVEGELEALEEMTSDPLWQQLPAVQNGRVITLDRLGYPGFRGQKALLADLVDALSAE